jgi:hypothetical protein
MYWQLIESYTYLQKKYLQLNNIQDLLPTCGASSDLVLRDGTGGEFPRPSDVCSNIKGVYTSHAY